MYMAESDIKCSAATARDSGAPGKVNYRKICQHAGRSQIASLFHSLKNSLSSRAAPTKLVPFSNDDCVGFATSSHESSDSYHASLGVQSSSSFYVIYSGLPIL